MMKTCLSVLSISLLSLSIAFADTPAPPEFQAVLKLTEGSRKNDPPHLQITVLGLSDKRSADLLAHLGKGADCLNAHYSVNGILYTPAFAQSAHLPVAPDAQATLTLDVPLEAYRQKLGTPQETLKGSLTRLLEQKKQILLKVVFSCEEPGNPYRPRIRGRLLLNQPKTVPTADQITTISVDKVVGNQHPTPEAIQVMRRDVAAMLQNWPVLDKEDWGHRSHPMDMASSGILHLKDGMEVAWLLRGDGLLMLTLPDGTRLYLGRDYPEK